MGHIAKSFRSIWLTVAFCCNSSGSGFVMVPVLPGGVPARRCLPEGHKLGRLIETLDHLRRCGWEDLEYCGPGSLASKALGFAMASKEEEELWIGATVGHCRNELEELHVERPLRRKDWLPSPHPCAKCHT